MNIKKLISVSLLFLSVCLILTACTPFTETKTLKIAVAANAQFAFEELTLAFEEKTQINCELIVGSSGKLSAQIKEGAPFDVFISADMDYPEALFEAEKVASKPQPYCRGQLILWTMGNDKNSSLDALTSENVQHIAMANPQLAPYGQAAEEVLNRLGLYQTVSTKLAFGESISQTNQFIFTGAAEVGFTAKSVVVSPNMQGKGNWSIVPDSLYQPIEQGLVVLNNRPENMEMATAFVSFILSENGQKILSRYGYLPPK